MRTARYGFIALCLLLGTAAPSTAGVSVGISLPNVSIGINLPLYPELVPIPGYPVYYAPQLSANYFFYDGLYWVYVDDNWYASSWYNGPWWYVDPGTVPLYVLRVPVRYYRYPPPYFRNWRHDAPPRWGERWGRDWERNRHGWDRWRRDAAPPPAPLPHYQRQYTGDRYPRAEQQQSIRRQQYTYQPRTDFSRRYYRQEGIQQPPRKGGQQDGYRPPPPPGGVLPRQQDRAPAPAQPPRPPAGDDYRRPSQHSSPPPYGQQERQQRHDDSRDYRRDEGNRGRDDGRDNRRDDNRGRDRDR